MKLLRMGDSVVELKPDFSWVSDNTRLAKQVNSFSQSITEEEGFSSPANGDPLSYLFTRIKDLFHGEVLVDDPAPLGQEDVDY